MQQCWVGSNLVSEKPFSPKFTLPHLVSIFLKKEPDN